MSVAEPPPVLPSPTGLRGRFFSLKWKTLALVSIVLTAIHFGLVFQGYYEQLSQYEARQALSFERQVTVLQKLIGQADTRLQRIGTLVPGVLNSMTIQGGFAEQWAGVQIELQLEVMQLYGDDGRVIVAGVNAWPAPPPEIGQRIAQALHSERPAGFILCRPACVQYAIVPILGAAGEHRLMLLGSSLADLVLEFPGITGASVALLAEAQGAEASYWGRYRLDAISDAPTNEPKLRELAQQVSSIETLEQGHGLQFGGRSYRFYARPLQAFGGVNPGVFLVFADTTQALADIRSQLVRQLGAGFVALLAALALLLAILNRPMNQLRKLARALPLMAQHQYQPARQMIGDQFRHARSHSEIDVLESVAVDVSQQLEELERTVEARSTDLAQSLADLKRANELNEKIFATAPMVILIQSADGEVLQLNEFGSQLLGYSAAEVRGMSFVSLLAEPRQREEAMTVLVDVVGGRRQMFEQTGPVRCVDESLERITWLHTRLAAQSGVFVLSVGLPDKSLEPRPAA